MKNKKVLFSASVLLFSQILIPMNSFAESTNTGVSSNGTSNDTKPSLNTKNESSIDLTDNSLKDDESIKSSEDSEIDSISNTENSSTAIQDSTEKDIMDKDNLISNVEANPDLNHTISTSLTSINLSTTYSDGQIFNGASSFALKIDMGNSSYKVGDKLVIQIDKPSVISQMTPNGGNAYGVWNVDEGAGTITYTITTNFPKDTILVINISTKNLDSIDPVKITTNLNNELVATNNFVTKYVKPSDGGGGYNGIMTFPAAGKYNVSNMDITSPSQLIENYVTSGAYLPTSPTINASFVYDAGFYNRSKNDMINRKITLSFFSNDLSVPTSIDPNDIYISNGGIYNTEKPNRYVPISSLGITATNIDSNTVELDLPDNQDFSWNIFYFQAKAPSLSATYKFTTKYTSDVYTTSEVQSLGGLYFQNIGNKGWAPNLNAPNKSIKLDNIPSNLSAWLLEGVTSVDEEDGDISENVMIDDDGGLNQALLKGENGIYTVIYSSTDSDGNKVTSSDNNRKTTVTIYSDITVHYQDSSGNRIKEPTTLSGNVGNSYTIDTSDFTTNGKKYYYVSSNPNIQTGKYGDNGQPTGITLSYAENKQAINASDFSMYVGDKEPTASDFKASATDKTGADSAVTVDLSKADLTKAGEYTVTITSADGQNKDVTLTVLENKQAINASDFSMYVGDKKPTASDFKASAKDKDGNDSAVTVDLSKADLTRAGDYSVTITSEDGQTKTVKLIIKKKEATPTINVEDKIMYVGDKLTKEDVLNWATFNNAEGLVQGFEVIGTSIPISSADRLTTQGVYRINYYIQEKTRSEESPLVQKEITLTVKEKKNTVTDPTDPSKSISSGTSQTPTSMNGGKSLLTTNATRAVPSTNIEKSLPSTGDASSNVWYVAGVAILALASGVFLWSRKTKKN